MIKSLNQGGDVWTILQSLTKQVFILKILLLKRAVLDNGSFQDIFNYLLDYLISSIPLIGSSLSFAFNVGSIMYDFMSSLDLTFYREKKHAIENTNQYIIGEHYWFTDYPNGMATGSYNTYSIGSGTYYGKEYQRGKFIETYIKSQKL